MCMICDNFDRLSTLEAVRNLSEMLDSIDREHAKSILLTISLREAESFNGGKQDIADSVKAINIASNLLDTLFEDDDEELKLDVEALKEEIELVTRIHR